MKLLALGSLLLTGVSNAALAQTWDGSSSSDWFVGDNWDTGTVPDGTADVIIDDITSNTPVAENALGNGPAQAQQLRVGENGTGALTIENGGRVENTQGFIGFNGGSIGTVTVTGAGSIWDNSSFLSVGEAGTGTLNIFNGGLVESTSGDIGFIGGSNGTVTVTGNGSTWDMSNPLRIGNGGTGTLNIQDGGRVENTQGFIGFQAGSTGTVTVTGAGSIWDNSSFLSVGENGTGTLNILNGGRVESTSGDIGFGGGSNGTVTVTGNGSTWDMSSALRVGNSGTGMLNIQDGGRVENTVGTIGLQAGSTGTVTVTGANSIWVNSSFLSVGENGTGTLNIQDGGRVEIDSQADIGFWAGSTGTATVTGTGSTLESTGPINVGGRGAGTLTIQDGGLVRAAFGRIGRFGTATGTLNIGAAAGDAAAAPGTFDAASLDFGDGSGTLVFNHDDATGTYSFDANILSAGAGTHTIDHHAGWTNYTGDGSGFGGATNINGGIFAVNGSLGGQVNVLGGGTLAGAGTLGGLVVVNGGGTIAPGNSIGTVNVTDITFDPGSVYAVEIDAAGNSDLINAGGTATINGGTVAVSGTAGAGNTYTILTAADPLAGVGRFDSLTGPSDTLFIAYALEYDPNNVYLTSEVDSFCSAAGSPNQKDVACDGLDSLPLGNDIAQAVLALTTKAEARAAYDALSGQIQSSAKSAVLDNSQHAVMAINQRMHGTFADGEGQSSVAAFGDLASDGSNGFWLTGYGSWADTGSNANTAQMDNELGGLVFGIDRQFSDTWRFGVLGGYSESDVAQDALRSSAQTDTWSLGLYGGAEAGANLLSFGAIYNWHDIDTSRTVRFPGVNQSLSASYDAQSWQLFAEAGREVQLDRVMLEPFAGISYISLDTDGFSETGGTAALTAGADTNSTTFTTLGARASMQVTNMVDARAMVGWRHAFGDTEGTTAFTLAGSNPFTVTGAPIAEDAFVTELGFEANISDNTFLGASYNGQYGDGTTGHGFNANFRVRF